MYALTVIVDGRLHSVDLFKRNDSAKEALKDLLLDKENPILDLEDEDSEAYADLCASELEFQDDNYAIKITDCSKHHFYA